VIIEILQAYEGWKPGELPDVLPDFAYPLIKSGIARAHEDQTRRDYTPKPKEETEPQKIEVHNYFIAPEEDATPPKKRKTKKVQ
jgi:hypothetical protein